MNNDDYEAVTAGPNQSIPAVISGINKNKIVFALSALAILAIGGLFLINYPLQTIVVGLLIASILVLDRA